VRAVYDIGDKIRILINGRYRIPDGLNTEALSEVKNVVYQTFTRQLRDFADFASQRGLDFDLYVRVGTRLSQPLLDAAEAGRVNIHRILQP
jgi:hypothetical protein